jgi:hypothetical protein
VARQLKSFGFYLRQFARSVDIVDERTIEEVRKLVYDYVRDELEIGFFTLAMRHSVNGEPGLQSRWRTEGPPMTSTIRAPDGSYSTQIAVAFDSGRPLWIVDPGQGPLPSCDAYSERWSDLASSLPRYQAPVSRLMRTSIVVPLTSWGDVLGVIYLESTRYLEFTEVAAQELLLLADSLAILFELRDANESQLTGTRDAVSELRDVLDDTTFPRLTKPQIFLASSARADDAVLGVVQVVLEEFADVLALAQWDLIDSSGSITARLIEEISRSRFGLCYLSEPAPSSPHSFQDNPNVLFEAGMLHALTNAPTAQPRAWIPVREADSPTVPFDFATERILVVPRTDDGALMEARLRDGLRRRVRALLDDATR